MHNPSLSVSLQVYCRVLGIPCRSRAMPDRTSVCMERQVWPIPTEIKWSISCAMARAKTMSLLSFNLHRVEASGGGGLEVVELASGAGDHRRQIRRQHDHVEAALHCSSRKHRART